MIYRSKSKTLDPRSTNRCRQLITDFHKEKGNICWWWKREERRTAKNTSCILHRHVAKLGLPSRAIWDSFKRFSGCNIKWPEYFLIKTRGLLVKDRKYPHDTRILLHWEEELQPSSGDLALLQQATATGIRFTCSPRSLSLKKVMFRSDQICSTVSVPRRRPGDPSCASSPLTSLCLVAPRTDLTSGACTPLETSPWIRTGDS